MQTNPFHIPESLWTVRFCFVRRLDGATAEKISDALEDLAVSVSLHNNESTDGDDWEISLTTEEKPDFDLLTARLVGIEPGILAKGGISCAPVVQKDWLKHVHENFPPVTVGGFFVFGSHYEDAPPDGTVPLRIDAATAFGSGEHETTRGCLLALERLKKQGRDFKRGLDMGCGSGILAVGMVKLWPDMRVDAVDIDPESVRVTCRHAEMNGVVPFVSARVGDGYSAAVGEYDIVVANILAGPLVEMAPFAARHLAAGGFLIVSGLLRRQGAEVISAHERKGLTLRAVGDIGEWQAIVFEKMEG